MRLLFTLLLYGIFLSPLLEAAPPIDVLLNFQGLLPSRIEQQNSIAHGVCFLKSNLLQSMRFYGVYKTYGSVHEGDSSIPSLW